MRSSDDRSCPVRPDDESSCLFYPTLTELPERFTRCRPPQKNSRRHWMPWPLLFVTAVILAGAFLAFPREPEPNPPAVPFSHDLVLKNLYQGGQDDYVFGTEYLRSDVVSITFLSSLDEVPENAVDVSETGAGKVLMWTARGLFDVDLFIAGDGKVIFPENCKHMFLYRNVETIEFSDAVDTSHVTDMSWMFSGCSSLESLDLSSFDTSYVTNMSGMFSHCERLSELDLNAFDTSRVTDMGGMFQGCSSLRSLDLSGFDTGKTERMFCMFSGCSSLESLDLSMFDTSSVKLMISMFADCSSLRSLNLSSFVSAEVTDMSHMFIGCSPELTLITDDSRFLDQQHEDLAAALDAENRVLGNFGWDEFAFGSEIKKSDVRSLKFLDSLAEAPEDAWDVSRTQNGKVLLWANPREEGYDLYIAGDGKVIFPEDCQSMFGAFRDMDDNYISYQNMEKLEFSGAVDTSRVTNMSGLFYGCSGLSNLDISCFDTGNVTKMDGMFYGCSGLPDLDVGGLDTRNVTDMNWMFAYCSGFSSLDLSNFDTSQVTNMFGMFAFCEGMTELDLSGFDTSHVESMEVMFLECGNLQSLNVSSFDTSGVTNMKNTFSFCENLQSLDLSSFDTGNVTEMDGMFWDCSPNLTLITDDSRLLNQFHEDIA